MLVLEINQSGYSAKCHFIKKGHIISFSYNHLSVEFENSDIIPGLRLEESRVPQSVNVCVVGMQKHLRLAF